MSVRDLIQHRAGVELPADGTWTIAPNQPVSGLRRGPFRTEKIPFRTAQGALTVSTDAATMALELGLRSCESAAEVPHTIWLRGHLRSADRLGRWRFDCTVASDGAASACAIIVDYQGVYRRGATAVAWLTIAELFLDTGPVRRGRRRGLHIGGELNAHVVGGGESAAGFVPGHRLVSMEGLAK